METIPVVTDHASAEFSFFALFMSADWVVKSVMVGLCLASVWCWSIIINRLALFGRTKRDIKAFEKAYASGLSFDDLRTKFATASTGMAPVFAAAMEEWSTSRAQNAETTDGLKSRINIALDLALSEQSDALEHRLGVLATVGSAAPFIGLFGTVWGIMNAFTAIAAAEDTSLAVVAPGIAEALFATALGLLAAIPAVIAYNKLSGDAAKLSGRLEVFADRLTAQLSREFDAKRNG